MSFKENHKKDRLSKIHYSMFVLQYHWNIEYSSSIHLFYGRFYLLALSYCIVTKHCTHLHNLAVEICQVCLSLHGILVPSVMKRLIRFIFIITLSTLWETIKKKIKRLVAHYWLTFWLTFGLHIFTITYMIKIAGFPHLD